MKHEQNVAAPAYWTAALELLSTNEACAKRFQHGTARHRTSAASVKNRA
jgi:hypothetical protein